MQTIFSADQRTDPVIREADAILRKCVHCGFCTATCPTYVLRGDELDSPRGRIYQIKDMYERGGVPPASTVKHLDRCLTCFSCMTTCPSGVDYRHLIDAARIKIEGTPGARPLADRLLRAGLAMVMTNRTLFRWAVHAANLIRPLAGRLPARLRPLVEGSPKRLPPPSPVVAPQVFHAEGAPRARVALLTGCAQAELNAEISAATIRLLTRLGAEVVVVEGAECCGALPHHLGQEKAALAKARATIEAWWGETRDGGGQGLDAVVIDASGCGSSVKDYGHMLAGAEPALAAKARTIAALALDVSEMIDRLGLPKPKRPNGLKVAYHSACSLQHGQKIRTLPQKLLAEAGFAVAEVPEGHLCCGSAATYSVLQPELSTRLKTRKAANIAQTQPDVVAAGNMGCLVQIGSAMSTPVVHTVQLLDWATGGLKPPGVG